MVSVACHLEGSRLKHLQVRTPGREPICRTGAWSGHTARRSAWAGRQPGAGKGGLDRGPGLAGKGTFQDSTASALGRRERGQRGVKVGQRLPQRPGRPCRRHSSIGFGTRDGVASGPIALWAQKRERRTLPGPRGSQTMQVTDTRKSSWYPCALETETQPLSWVSLTEDGAQVSGGGPGRGWGSQEGCCTLFPVRSRPREGATRNHEGGDSTHERGWGAVLGDGCAAGRPGNGDGWARSVARSSLSFAV